MHEIHKASGGQSCFCPICIKYLEETKKGEDTLNKIPNALKASKEI